MAITIVPVTTRKQLKSFIRFNYELYKGNPYSVPDLYEDMLGTLDKERNAAFDFCEAEYFLAMRDGEIVGRVAAIINRRANEKWGIKAVRFGWIDFVDDAEVSKALLETVEQWGRERGMTEIQGPLGFTDLDAEGMLIEGFDRLSTMATIYNYPYYPRHMEQLGYTKDTDWIELLIKVPEKTPEKIERIATMVAKRFELKYMRFKSNRELERRYGREIFDLINRSYAPLYGFSALSDRQIEQYIKMYLPLVDRRMITLITNKEDKLVGVGITITSLAEALQKAKGKLFPFGWFHILKALFIKRPTRLDFLIVAIDPEYQGKGINAMIISDILPNYVKMGFKDVETNPELESNNKVQSQWELFDKEQHKRRRAYKKEL
ncbi:MAG: GNAT family N-acetyltransferase [Bacteroidaceae bacterium]|nr:GNAT family N-acetyltransferase [Bacteroidaceae bacterium]